VAESTSFRERCLDGQDHDSTLGMLWKYVRYDAMSAARVMWNGTPESIESRVASVSEHLVSSVPFGTTRRGGTRAVGSLIRIVTRDIARGVPGNERGQVRDRARDSLAIPWSISNTVTREPRSVAWVNADPGPCCDVGAGARHARNLVMSKILVFTTAIEAARGPYLVAVRALLAARPSRRRCCTDCPGWIVSESYEIQICDECAIANMYSGLVTDDDVAVLPEAQVVLVAALRARAREAA
jgi:hypothetical protein